MNGSKLIKGVDAGGVRWYLDGNPVHAGTELQILCVLNPECEELSSRIVKFDPLWVPVRLEFDYKEVKAFAYWPVAGPDEMRSEVPESASFRWPGRKP